MDFYVLLGIEREASLDEVKRAYRRLARRYHPDINPGDRVAAARFRYIAEAYETLSDAERRRGYDSGAMETSADEAPTFEGFDFSVSASGPASSTFGDLFADVLQHRGAAQQATREPERGADLHQTLVVPFEDSIQGVRRQVTLTRQARCRRCQGAGSLRAPETRCTRCQGAGVVKSVRGHMVFSKACTDCRGTGRLLSTRCPACAGQQTEIRTESLSLAVPPGVRDGAQVRVPEKGHAGRNGGGPGDLYITVHVEEHPLFRRDGDNLHVVVPIALHEAALGAKIDVPTVQGAARLRVPPGTQSGQHFYLRERGVPSPRGDRHGDLIVEVRLVLPKVLDERSKELLREFGRLNREDVRHGLMDTGGQERVEPSPDLTARRS
jgi:molecular chaperone DnaJ